nr:DUF4135 domain-containing protein [Kosakonia sp. MUSA4]
MKTNERQIIAAHPEKDKQVKLPVIEPYRAYIYIPYLKTFNEKTMSLLKTFGMERLNFSNMSETISECLDQIFLHDFVVSFDKWLRQQESSECDRYKNHFKDKNNKWQGKLQSETLYITSLALKIINSTIGNIREYQERFTDDYGRISEEFGFSDGIDWVSMEILGGDRHENGRQPIRISAKNFSVVYKPRSTGTESVLNKICNVIGFYDICPKTIDKKIYMWQSFGHYNVSIMDNVTFGTHDKSETTITFREACNDAQFEFDESIQPDTLIGKEFSGTDLSGGGGNGKDWHSPALFMPMVVWLYWMNPPVQWFLELKQIFSENSVRLLRARRLSWSHIAWAL